VAAPRSRAARVGTGATSPPSARHRVPISTGSNKPGKAQLARMASTRLPCVNTRVRQSSGPWPPRQEECGDLQTGAIRKRVRLNSKTLVACQAEPGDAPSSDVPKAERTAGLNDARKRRAAGIGSAENAATLVPRCERWDVVLFEDLQNAEMREAGAKPPPRARLAPARLDMAAGLSFRTLREVCACLVIPA